MIARGLNTSALDNGMLSVGDIGGSIVGWRCLSNGTFDDCMVKLANRDLMDCEKRHSGSPHAHCGKWDRRKPYKKIWIWA